MDTNQTPKIDRATWLQLFCACLADPGRTVAGAAAGADEATLKVIERYPDAAPCGGSGASRARWGHIEVFGRESFDALVTDERRGGAEGLRLRLDCARGHVVLDRWYSDRAIYSDDYAHPEVIERRAREWAEARCLHPDCVAARVAEREGQGEYERQAGKVGYAMAAKMRETGRRVSSSDIWNALEQDQETAGKYQVPTEDEQRELLGVAAAPEAVRQRWPHLAQVLAGGADGKPLASADDDDDLSDEEG